MGIFYRIRVRGVIGVLCVNDEGLALAGNLSKKTFGESQSSVFLWFFSFSKEYIVHIISVLSYLLVEGSASEVHAGIISGIAQEAEKLYPDIDESPVIVLESDTW